MNDKLPRIIFFGNNSVVLDFLIKNSTVLAVFCKPANESDENINQVKKMAEKYLIPVKQPFKNNIYDQIDYIEKLNADAIIVCGYNYILPKEIFTISKFGAINIHPSYLPLYRGQHVINWAIINGEKETGITIHFIDEGIDTGDIILQKKVPILFEDTAKTLHDKLYKMACKLLPTVLNSIASGEQIKRRKQDDTKATYFKPRVPENGQIDWHKNGIEIYNMIRALAKPWPGAYSYIRGKKIVIWAAKFKENSNSHYLNGEIININDSIMTVNLINGQIIIDDYSIFNTDGKEIRFNINDGDIFEGMRYKLNVRI